MAKFIIYCYKLHQSFDSVKGPMFEQCSEITPEEALNNKQEYFQKIFKEAVSKEVEFKCTLKKGKGIKQFESRILWSEGDITLMQIANKHNKTKHEKFQIVQIEDNPWCNIIIDNRHDCQHIAIQSNSAFSKTDTVAKILQESINNRLYYYHLETNIDAMYQSDAFWSVISQYKEQGIKMIQFDFAFPNFAWAAEALKNINKGARSINSRPSLMFTAPKDGKLKIDAQKQDSEIQAYVNICSGTGAEITIKPNGKTAPIKCNKKDQQRIIKELNEDVFESQDSTLFNSRFEEVAEFVNELKHYYE